MIHWDKIPHKYPPRENQKIAIDQAVTNLLDVGFHGHLMEMSLGKTKCALNEAEILQAYGAASRLLIICPKTIQDEWVPQIAEHSFFECEPLIWENSKTQKFQRRAKELLTEDFPILMVRLEMFQGKNEVLKKYLQTFFQGPTYCVLDESSKIKNVLTQRTPRLIEYTRGARYRSNLTGTPWTESPLDIFSQMEFLKSGFWYKYNGEWKVSLLKKHWYLFRNRYAVMQDIRTSEGRAFKTVVGTRRTEEIAAKIRPYVTQQKTEDWQDLPPQIFQVLEVEMSKAQSKAYTTLKEQLLLEHGDELLTAANNAVLLTQLRQIAGGFLPGTGEMIDKHVPGIDLLLEDVCEYSGKVLISCAYVAEVDGIVSALRKEYGHEAVETFYGATKERSEVKRRFKEEDVRFLVGTEKVMAYGHNWQFCSLMYIYSQEFSYETHSQLLRRTHRPGMTKSCRYKTILHKGTVQNMPIKAFGKKKDVVEAFDRQVTLREVLDT